MLKKRFLSVFSCFCLILGMIPTKGEAYERKGHDQIMLKVLFRQYEYAYSEKSAKDKIGIISSACYLTIDQWGTNGQNELDRLVDYGVVNIPKQVSEIGFSASPRNHRDYTHRGWDFDYLGEMRTKWPLRKDILRNTVSTVFDFQGNAEQQEAFCELLYYIHILGDHEDDTSFTTSNGRKIALGGRHDQYDIIHRLLGSFEDLFADQAQTHKYSRLMAKLRGVNSKLDKLVNSSGGINTQEKFNEYKEYVTKTINILSAYVPKLLKEERFFNEVFYDDIQPTEALNWFDNLIHVA